MANTVKLHQGDSCYIPIELIQDRVPVDAELLSELEICIGSHIVRRISDGGVMQQDGDTNYYIKLTQEETRRMRPGNYDAAARATYRGNEENAVMVHIGRVTILPEHC